LRIISGFFNLPSQERKSNIFSYPKKEIRDFKREFPKYGSIEFPHFSSFINQYISYFSGNIHIYQALYEKYLFKIDYWCRSLGSRDGTGSKTVCFNEQQVTGAGTAPLTSTLT
jgi:hypothetical protein